MNQQNLRIVSLLPGATEILVALGLTDAIVGRSHECDYPPEIQSRPVCTSARINSGASSAKIHQDINELLQSALSIYQVKTDVLEQLQPTHIVTQDQCDVCAVSLKEVEAAVATLTHLQPQIISLKPNVLADVLADIETIAKATEVDSRRVVENLESRIKICQQKLEGLSFTELPTVACIEWIEPLMTASNWIPELVTISGGQPLFSAVGQPSAQINWDTLVATNPSVIVFMPCGLDLNRTLEEALILPSVQSGKTYALSRPKEFTLLMEILTSTVQALGWLILWKLWQKFYIQKFSNMDIREPLGKLLPL